MKRYNPWWYSKFDIKGIIRKVYLERLEVIKNRKDIVFIVGLRRVGKTTLLYQQIIKLLDENDSFNILYFSMDHPVLIRKSILDILDAYRRIHGLSHTDNVTVLIDEVHLRDGFEKELKTIYDMGHVKIYASGSSSIFLLQKGAFLTGRQRNIEVFPFSFNEYLEIKEINIKPGDEQLLIKYAEDYVRDGGLPEYLKTNDPEYITNLIDSVVYKDVAGRHSVSNVGLLKDMMVLLSQSLGGRISTRKIGRVLGTSHETVSKYLSYFEETNLINLIEKDGKASERKSSPRKIYLTDTGIGYTLTPSVNLGSLVENCVFNELRKEGEVRYGIHNGKEIDFITQNKIFEVKYKNAIDPEEIKHLDKLRIKKRKYVITKGAKGDIGKIRLLPLYEFLIDGY